MEELNKYKRDLENISTKYILLEKENKELREKNDELNRKLTIQLNNNAVLEEKLGVQNRNNEIYITVPRKIEGEEGLMRKYTAYVIEVEGSENKRYQVTRRYKQFVLLHTQLVRVFGEHDLPSLPAKANGLYFSKDDHTEKRRVNLQEYLQNLAKNPAILNSPVFYHFLKRDEGQNVDHVPSSTPSH
ncbi:hypothetical protein ACTFIZ_003003 [Dictyostelium cf. discoideum]